MDVIKNANHLNEDDKLTYYENMFNALADKNRLKILTKISQSTNKSLQIHRG